MPVNSPQVEFGYPAQNGLAAGEGFIYITDMDIDIDTDTDTDEILKIRQSTGDVSARFDAPNGERAGLAYSDGSLWFVTPSDGRSMARFWNYTPELATFDHGFPHRMTPLHWRSVTGHSGYVV